MLKKIILSLICMFIVLGVAGAVYWTLAVLAKPWAKPVFLGGPSGAGGIGDFVYADTVVREEYAYLCGDVQVVFLGRAPKELVGFNRSGLEQKYSAQDGWTIEMTPDTLVLKKTCLEFCSKHAKYRHLGISEGCLAVFEGPLGNNQRLLRVEKIPLENLPAEYQVKLEQVMNFSRQSPENQAALREELEFAGESSLNAFLENLDEQIITGPVS
jgi:hypothetical protein